MNPDEVNVVNALIRYAILLQRVADLGILLKDTKEPK